MKFPARGRVFHKLAQDCGKLGAAAGELADLGVSKGCGRNNYAPARLPPAALPVQGRTVALAASRTRAPSPPFVGPDIPGPWEMKNTGS